MKLILKSNGKGGRGKKLTGANIGKTVISISSRIRLMGVTKDWYGAFGYDEDMNTSLFLSKKKKGGFFKLTTAGGKRQNLYISISKLNREVMKDFMGEYEFENQYKKDDVLIINIKRV